MKHSIFSALQRPLLWDPPAPPHLSFGFKEKKIIITINNINNIITIYLFINFWNLTPVIYL